MNTLIMNNQSYWKRVVFMFPITLSIGIVLIPVVSDYSDHALAEEAAQQSVRWFLGHIVSGIAFGLAILASVGIAQKLVERGMSGLARAGMVLVTIGAALHIAGLGADGVGPLSFANAGGRQQDFFEGSAVLVPLLFVAGSATFGTGQMLLIVGAIRSVTLTQLSRILLSLAGVAFIVFEVVPSGWGLYGVAAAAWIIYSLMARYLWQDEEIQ